MKKTAIIIAGAVLLVLAACSTGGDDSQYKRFSEEGFKNVDTLTAVHNFPEISFGRVSEMCYHPAGYILIADLAKGNMLQVVDVSNGKLYQTLISRGRANSELLGISEIRMDGEDVVVSSMTENKILRLGLSDSLSVTASLTTERQFNNAVPYGDGYLTVASAPSYNRMEVLDDAGAVIDTIGSFPDIGFDAEAYNNALFQPNLAVSPDGRHVVLSCNSVDFIDIYGKDGNLSVRLHGPDHKLPGYKSRSFGMGVVYAFDPNKHSYSGITATDSGFYVGRLGVDLRTEEDLLKGISAIYFFSWSGEPETRYVLDEELTTFAVDEKNGIIYGVTNSDGTKEPELVSFAIPHD